jgi:hypothetical protein
METSANINEASSLKLNDLTIRLSYVLKENNGPIYVQGFILWIRLLSYGL